MSYTLFILHKYEFYIKFYLKFSPIFLKGKICWIKKVGITLLIEYKNNIQALKKHGKSDTFWLYLWQSVYRNDNVVK